MPISAIKHIATATGVSTRELEGIWNKAVSEADNKGIKNKYAYAMAVIQRIKKKTTNDTSGQRYTDDNGYLICPNSILTGDDIAKYWGYEIPYYEKLGLNPNIAYDVYRPIEEIGDNDFNGKPLLDRHIGDFSSDTFSKYKKFQIGTVHDTRVEGDKLLGTVTFYDAKAIDDLDDGKRYLSCGYFYDPVVESGTHQNRNYDIRMTNIRANHIAHVSNPRYKQAVVGDEDVSKLVHNAKILTLVKTFGF